MNIQIKLVSIDQLNNNNNKSPLTTERIHEINIVLVCYLVGKKVAQAVIPVLRPRNINEWPTGDSGPNKLIEDCTLNS